MISCTDEFKKDREEVFASKDVKKIRAYAEKYHVKLFGSDADILKAIESMPKWE